MSLLPAFLTDSLDEVVFEGRNQAYGAYQLRQAYQQHLTSAGGLTLALGVGLAIVWNICQAFAPLARPVAVVMNPVEANPKEFVLEKPKLAVLTPARSQRVATHAMPTMPTQVAKDEAVVPKPVVAPVLEEIQDGSKGLTTPGPATAIEGLTDPGGPAVGNTATGPATTPNEPFIAVEKMPEFAGGQAALLTYLRNHLRYPSAALAAGVSGRVFMSFVVQADGTISDVTILKGLGYGLDEEAQRVVRQMPAWTPGYQSKHAVAVRFTLPITFQYQ